MKTTEQQHNERKQELMEKCFECYAENGLTGTGIKALAEACGCPLDAVSVKATTTERLGFTGRGEGVAAEAVALLQTVPYTGSGPQNVAGAGDDGGHH